VLDRHQRPLGSPAVPGESGGRPQNGRERVTMRSYGHDQPIETAVEAEAPTFGEAVNDAAVRLGVSAADLAIEILDPGAGEGSSTGFRSVKIRARRAAPPAAGGESPPPAGGAARGARAGPRPKPAGEGRSYDRGGYDRGGRGSR